LEEGAAVGYGLAANAINHKIPKANILMVEVAASHKIVMCLVVSDLDIEATVEIAKAESATVAGAMPLFRCHITRWRYASALRYAAV